MTGMGLAVVETRFVSPAELAVGDAVLIFDFLPSDEGFRHVVDDVRDVGDGFVRVWFDVYVNGAPRWRAEQRWDRVYDLADRRGVPMVEVVA